MPFRRANLLAPVAFVLTLIGGWQASPVARAAGFRGDRSGADRSGGAADQQQPPQPAPPSPQRVAAHQALSQWLDRLPTAIPRRATDFATQNLPDFREAANSIDGWAAETTRFSSDPKLAPGPEELYRVIEHLLDAKERVDRLLEQTFEQRAGFGSLDAAVQHKAILNFLATTSGLIDLSGRLRYLTFDALEFVIDDFDDRPADRDRLLELLLAHRSSIGAMAMAEYLFDPKPEAGQPAPQPTPAAVKRRVIELIAATHQIDLLGRLAEFVRDPATSPDLLLTAAEAIRTVGVPQDLRPGQDPEVPKPAITARQLHDLLARVPADAWQGAEHGHVDELLAWLEKRASKGVTEDRLRMGPNEVQPGDWLLMRNPSPYNLFTDLSPGLFTHVGVVAAETGPDGIRRFVLVDLPERGTQMPATNVDTFVNRSLHYVFLRHPDPAVARKMGETAASLIGAPTEFDLNFRTDRVTALKGKSLTGRKIHAYCAGFLLLCAQETGRPREDFFPVPEAPAGGSTRTNLAKIGITFGDNFISPTGALFSPKLQIVGGREPMYDSQREVEEAIYDHFAEALKQKQLVPSPDLFQSLRQKVAEASRDNPLLAKAIADAAGVDKDLDLASAAKTQAVVETLDEIAYGNSGEYLAARQAIMDGPQTDPPPAGTPKAEAAAKAVMLRTRHAKLAELWDKQQVDPRMLRMTLVRYYIQRGREQLDARFFVAPGEQPAK